MAFVKKVVSCKCGRNFYFEFSSDMEVEDLTVSSKCPSCGNGLYVTVSSMGSAQSPASPAPVADLQAQPGLTSISSPSPESSRQNDWNIEDLEHVPSSQEAESTRASEVSPSASGLGKQAPPGSKSSAINDAMNDLFKEE